MEIFSVKNLSFKYPECSNFAIKDCNFKVNKGDFVVLCGKSGCGKTTLLRLLKPEISPFGNVEGKIFFMGEPLKTLSRRDSAEKIGFVMQNPQSQVVTDRVSQELAFGLENLGAKPDEIRQKIAEISSFFGIDGWISDKTFELSGGQKQILSLASVMILNPDVIILDEPSSQLDPVSTDNFFSVLRLINEHFGTTILLCEHRLEECFSMADMVIYMENGTIKFVENPQNTCEKLYKTQMNPALPCAVRIFGDKVSNDHFPISIKDGREFLRANFKENVAEIKQFNNKNDFAIDFSDVWFRYEKNSSDILKGVDLKVRKGEILSILGGNGAGKTTLLKVISKLAKPYKCKGKILGKDYKSYKSNSLYKGVISVLSQDPYTMFSSKTVREDFVESCKAFNLDSKEKISEIATSLGIENLLDKHPFDLSGGEIQKCALGRVLICDPQILLLDEPTKGLDSFAKLEIGYIIKLLAKRGITIVIVTHDVEFSAEFADECCLLFKGEIVSRDCPQKFFSDNHFYTTAARIIAKEKISNAVTVEQVRKCLVEVHDES